jgi:DHA2 family multidrug resistance protein
MAAMLGMGWLIGRTDHRTLLAAGLVIMATALFAMAQVNADIDPLWLAAASGLQGLGVGLMFTPLSVRAFATLAQSLRADAAGLIGVLRQLGSATGVALLTALLRTRLAFHLAALSPHGAVIAGLPARSATAAAFLAYGDCFRVLAIATLFLLPGLLLFRPVTAEAEAA